MKAEDINPNRFVLDTQAAGELRAKIAQDPQAGLKQAAQQFEGMLLQMVMKSMRDATPQDGLMDSDQTRFYTSILDQQLAQNLAAKGSLGFARMIEEQLGRNMASGSGDSTGSAQSILQQSLLQQQIASTAASMQAGAVRWRSMAGVTDLPAQADATGGAWSASSTSNNEFVSRLWPHAINAANSLGVPAQFLVAQAALETGWGKSEIVLADGSPSYNLFGVKAGRNWAGPSVEIQTTEYVDGVAQSSRERFRVYGSYAEAFQDYANLLRANPRFSGVLGQQDGTQFARSLQQGGYATDPAYADKLARIINGTTLRQALSG